MTTTSGTGSGVRGEINVTPLVDVVLVLLIIFMVVTPVVRMGHEASIPPAGREGKVRGPLDQLVVRLEANGELFINGDRVEAGSFAAKLRQVLEGRAAQPTFVAAPDTVSYQKVMRFMEICRGAGATNLAIVVNDLTSR